MDFGLSFDFEKADATGGYVRGWASVISVNGSEVADHQNDTIEMAVLRKAAHRFIAEQRVAKAMHSGSQVGEVVESVIIDDDFVKAMGASTPNRGLWIGMAISDPKIKKRIASGELRAFSIGGRGKRKKVG